MTAEIQTYPLPIDAIGTHRKLVTFRYGKAGARPKVYMQAALHADELPGQLVLHYLRRRLDIAAKAGLIQGEIILVPVANPIGLSQVFDGSHLGRFEMAGGENFNRGYPDLSVVGDHISDTLGHDPKVNLEIVRKAMRAHLNGMRPRNQFDALRYLLVWLAIDADWVLDLHCDHEAELHIYTGDLLWPEVADLSAELGAKAVLLARTSGGHPFDEAFSGAFATLHERFGSQKPIPETGCVSATIELRGQADVSIDKAARDAEALFRFLCRRGVIAGESGLLPEALCSATPLSGVDMVHATAPGIVVFRAEIGSYLKAGDLVAEIVDPTAQDVAAPGVPIVTRTSGALFARIADRLAWPGKIIAKVAGIEPLPDRTGQLLTN